MEDFGLCQNGVCTVVDDMPSCRFVLCSTYTLLKKVLESEKTVCKRSRWPSWKKLLNNRETAVRACSVKILTFKIPNFSEN